MATVPPSSPTHPQCSCALLVDSNPEVNKLLMGLFEEGKWSIQVAADNREALRLAEVKEFDLIITGQKSGGQEDIELLGRLRAIYPHTRLIIVTDKFTPGDVLAAIRARAFSYFSAPFSTERFAEMIRIAMTEAFWDDGIEVLSATPSWVCLCVRCDLVTANRLLQFYREASPLPGPETEEVATAFREILLNAMEHGGKFDPKQHVEISYVRTERMIICSVKDPGHGFSTNELKSSAISNPPEDPFRHMAVREAEGKRPGGFGIMMAKKLVDELIYNEQGNEVLLIKYLDTPAK